MRSYSADCPEFSLSDYAFGMSCKIWCTNYEDRRLPFAKLRDLKQTIKNRWNEVTIEAQFENLLHNGKKDFRRRRIYSPLNAVKNRMEARLSTFSANGCDRISI